MPLTLAPGQKTIFSVVFAPASRGNITGSVSLVSNAPNSPTTIALSGIGVQPLQPQLSVVPPSASFGDVAVGTRNSQTITLINSGTGNVTISQATPSGNGFSMTAPLTLAAGQTASFSMVFASTTLGTATGNVSLVSNATNSPTISLSASSVQPIPLARTLSWNPSPSGVSYNVYRGTQSGGSYQK